MIVWTVSLVVPLVQMAAAWSRTMFVMDTLIVWIIQMKKTVRAQLLVMFTWHTSEEECWVKLGEA